MYSSGTGGGKSRAKSVLLGTTLLAGIAVLAPAAAQAQDSTTTTTTATTTASDSGIETVTVTGYKYSLKESTEAKRNSITFSDTIFAEDIGKFPDTNVAESFNRIPGVTISREITGEGQEIAIRGLGTDFTKVLLNGASVAIASTGRTDSQDTNREVDLDMFPTELFTQLTVNKTSTAAMLEGGAAGTVDMRSARPFDNPGEHLTYSFQGLKNSNANDWGQHGSLIASDTWGPFGILVGAVGVHDNSRVTGFETIGWTTPNVSAAQCGTGNTCNQVGGGNWTIPATVPANAGNGLTTGAPIDAAFLTANNPGLTTTQISNALIPRLGRPMDEFGTRDQYNGIVSLEYRPNDNLHFYLDTIYGNKNNNLQRIDMDWVGRNGAMIPLNMQVDSNDVVTNATFANAQFFLEYRPYIEQEWFESANPGMEWQITDLLKLDVQGNLTRSHFHRESPTLLVITPASSGVTVDYTNDGAFPTIGSNVDLNNPANFEWPGGRVNIQDEYRTTYTRGARGDLTYGGDELNLKVGAAYDEIYRTIKARDNSQAWQNAICGDDPNVFLPSPNSQPSCQGLDTPTPGAGYPTYPGLGTDYSTGYPALAYQGSLVPESALASYLKPGPDGFITADWKALAAASDYAQFHNSAPSSTSSNTGASGGLVDEKATGAFVEVNGEEDFDDNKLLYNAGVRWVRTDQTIGGYVSIQDPRDVASPAPADGGLYPNIVNFVETNRTYYNLLPAMNVVYDIGDNMQLRGALSQTMTRPDPNTMLPGLNFSTPSADVGSIGNPALKPYLSNNIDLGWNYFEGGEGYFGITAFRKTVKGFTVNGTTTDPFSALAAYGVNYNTLTPTQQAAIDARGGPTVATVVLQEQVNASGLLFIDGLEFDWDQPLDFILDRWDLDGFGFTANATIVDQRGSGAAPAVAIGVPPWTANVTGYYENHGASVRVSYVFNAASQASGTNQNGIPNAALWNNEYAEWDMSASYDLNHVFDNLPGSPELTFDVLNATDAKQRQYFEFKNAAYTYYDPGSEYMVGIRGRF